MITSLTTSIVTATLHEDTARLLKRYDKNEFIAEIMQNSTNESSELASPEVSNGHYTVIVTDSTDSTHPDEFVLDLSSLPCGSDYTFDTSSISGEESLQDNIYDLNRKSLDVVAKGTKRRFEIEDISEVNISEETRSSGYESDTEHGDDSMVRERKKKKIRYNKYKAQRSPSNILTGGEKRKYFEEENVHQRKKKLKTSPPGKYDKLSSSVSSSSSCSDLSSTCSDSSSDSSCSSSDSSSNSGSSSCSCTDKSSDSSSDNETINEGSNYIEAMPYKYLNSIGRILPCAESCPCKAGQRRPPIPIERSSRPIQSLYKKLLQRRLLSMANTFSYTCCYRKCYLDWTRKRISLSRMVKDYSKSDLRVDYFSWGQSKQTPEVDGESSSEEDWY